MKQALSPTRLALAGLAGELLAVKAEQWSRFLGKVEIIVFFGRA